MFLDLISLKGSGINECSFFSGRIKEGIVCLVDLFFINLVCLFKSSFFWVFSLECITFFCKFNCVVKWFCWGRMGWDKFKSLFCDFGILGWFEGIVLLFLVGKDFWIFLELVIGSVIWDTDKEELGCLDDVFCFNLFSFCKSNFFWIFWLDRMVFFCIFNCCWSVFKLLWWGWLKCLENFFLNLYCWGKIIFFWVFLVNGREFVCVDKCFLSVIR